MKIGVVSSLDIGIVAEYFNSNDQQIIQDNRIINAAPAVTTLVASLVKQGYYIRIFTLSTKTSFHLKSDNIEIYAVKHYTKYPFKYIWGLYANCARLKKVISTNINDLDIIQTHWTYEYALATLPYAKLKPIYCTVRDWYSVIIKYLDLRNKLFYLPRCLSSIIVHNNKYIRFIANSEYTADLIKKHIDKHTPIIHNPIKSSFIKSEEHIYPDYLHIVCVSSSLDNRKNIDTLLYAVCKVREKYPTAQLTIAGSPFHHDNPAIKKWISAGLGINVNFIGRVSHDELKKLYDSAWMFVTPSLEETFGNTLIESFARKVPVLGGINSGAVPFVLHHGKCGNLCDVSDIDKLADTILYMYEHPEEVKVKTDRAFTITCEKYLDDKIVDKYINLYKSEIQ